MEEARANGERLISIDEMEAMLDHIPAAIFISASDNKELLYANLKAKELPIKMGSPKRMCYHMLGYQQPCPFCAGMNNDGEGLMEQEFSNPCNNRIYSLSGKRISWGGRPAYMEHLLDITEKKRDEEEKVGKFKDELKGIFTHFPCGLGIYRFDGHTLSPLYHNPAYYEITSYSDEHIESIEVKTNFLGVHPEDLRPLKKKIGETIIINGVMRFIYRLWNDKKSEYMWICLDGAVKPCEDGTQLLYGVFTDISEQKRLEIYFKNLVEKIPGGISVIRFGQDGNMTAEFVSDRLASMVRMTIEEVKHIYSNGILAGFREDYRLENQRKLTEFIEKGEGYCEFTGRLQRGDGSFIWVSMISSCPQTADGIQRIYSVYTDISKSVEEKEQLRRQYNEQILKHYRTPGPNALVIGHCNVTQDKILEIIDYTKSNLLDTFGSVRQNFFIGISGFVVDKKERQTFLETYLNQPLTDAFGKKDTEKIMNCFVKLPQEKNGRYVQFKVNLVETPDTGDITGILTVTDITEQTIANRIFYQMSVAIYDFVLDLDLDEDTYTVKTAKSDVCYLTKPHGPFSEKITYIHENAVVPKDKDQFAMGLNSQIMRERLKKEQAYTFTVSLVDEKGDIRTKNMVVSATDLRLGRVCLMCTDITESVREQQGLLNMMAYTFELMGFITISNGRFVMYTRRAVLENLPPRTVENYNNSIEYFADSYANEESQEEIQRKFSLENLLFRLKEEPAGFDFVIPHRSREGLRYKQINVMWGNQNHRTICVVRADVTDMLVAERQSKEALEKALALAESANMAKSDFLSAMSHDIRTPMNAIMGLTALAIANLNNPSRMENYLEKITISSKHLLSLINDVLDMSRIERSKIALNKMKIFLPELIGQVTAIMEPQARENGLKFNIEIKEITHEYVEGDSLRINQILINLLSNAVKFTPRGGSVTFRAEEIPAINVHYVRYRFTVIDTGIGIPEDSIFNIFAPFSRNCKDVRIEGTGLGLSIAKGLVDLMEGKLSVKSQENKGSVFKVELECKMDQEQGTALEKRKMDHSIKAGEKHLKNHSFLVVEDNAINAEILCELLQMQGAKTSVRENGAQAVRAFEEKAPGTYDAILMDIQMPDMNGYEATKIIRRMNRADAMKIPIIAMTANAFSEDIQASGEAGMNAHVSKPIDVDVLWQTLDHVLNR